MPIGIPDGDKARLVELLALRGEGYSITPDKLRPDNRPIMHNPASERRIRDLTDALNNELSRLVEVSDKARRSLREYKCSPKDL